MSNWMRYVHRKSEEHACKFGSWTGTLEIALNALHYVELLQEMAEDRRMLPDEMNKLVNHLQVEVSGGRILVRPEWSGVIITPKLALQIWASKQGEDSYAVELQLGNTRIPIARPIGPYYISEE